MVRTIAAVFTALPLTAATVAAEPLGGNSWTIDGMTMRQRLLYSQTGN